MKLFKTIQPLISYIEHRSCRAIERKESDNLKEYVKWASIGIALCETTQDLYNTETVIWRDMDRRRHVRGWAQYMADLQFKISMRQAEILQEMKESESLLN